MWLLICTLVSFCEIINHLLEQYYLRKINIFFKNVNYTTKCNYNYNLKFLSYNYNYILWYGLKCQRLAVSAKHRNMIK